MMHEKIEIKYTYIVYKSIFFLMLHSRVVENMSDFDLVWIIFFFPKTIFNKLLWSTKWDLLFENRKLIYFKKVGKS